MNTVKKLFIHRITNEWKYQIRTWRVVIDWTVALYFVVPIIIFVIETYIDWLKAPPIWMHQVTFSMLASILFFFIIQGNIRVFVEEADILFLFQQNQWIRQLNKLGIAYSIVINLFVSLLLFIVLSPFLLSYYKITFFQIIIWYIFFVTLKTLTGVNKQLVYHNFSGWKSGLTKWLIYLVTGIYYCTSLILFDNTSLFFLVIFIPFILLLFLLHHLMALRNTFFKDIASEQVIKLRYVKFILRTSRKGYGKSSIILFNKKPWIFSHSNQIFKERNAKNLLAETCLKSVVRNNTNIYDFLNIIVLFIIIALSIPVNWKWIILVIFAFPLAKFVETYWEKTKYNYFTQMFPWKADVYRKAAVKATFIVFSVFFLPISFTLGMTAYSWPGAVLFIVLGEIIGYLAVCIVQKLSSYSS